MQLVDENSEITKLHCNEKNLTNSESSWHIEKKLQLNST